MKRGAHALAAIAALVLASCSDGGAASTTTPSTISSGGSLAPALLTSSQLRRVPGFSTATLTSVPKVEVFDDPNPRGPCGGAVPRINLDDAIGSSWTANTIRSGAQLVLRRPATELQTYMAARIRDAVADCPVFQLQSRTGVAQEMKFDDAVNVTRDADQSLAIVMAIRLNGEVRAATTIEIRNGNVLSRAVVFSSRPMPRSTVRGIASLMAKSLQVVG